MSPLFVKSFRAGVACAECRGPKSSERLMCAKHLAIARLNWRIWAASRRQDGLCDACDKRELPGKGRCRKHRERNRLKCKAWGEANKDRAWAYDKERDRTYTEKGLCRACPEHRPLTGGFRRCEPCRVASRVAKKGVDPADKPLTVRERALLRDKKVVAEAAEKLREMGFQPVLAPAHFQAQNARPLQNNA